MPRSTRAFGIAAGAAVLAAAVTATVVLWPGDDSDDAAPTTAPAATAAPASTDPVESVESAPPTSEADEAVDASPTLVASFAGDALAFDAPDGAETGVVSATWHDRPSVLPVIDEAPGWLKVRLPQRPNGSTAWVRSDDVRLASTPFRVEIDVATNRLRLFESGVEVLDAPAGLGTEDAPTTVGNFFVAFMQEPPDTTSGWGPFVIVTSSHSETISDFQSSGDAIAAIHGPLGAAEEIGESGTKVSHGCIRLLLDDLEVLRQLPAGTPIDVIDSSAASDSSTVASTVPSSVPVGESA